MCRQLLEGPLSQDDRCNAYNPQRWRRLADLCIQQGRIDVAQQCAQSAGDLALSLLLISCTGDKPGLYAIAKQAEAQNQMNIAFLALYIAGDAEACLSLLQRCDRLPEAAFFSLSHIPSHVNSALQMWEEALRKDHHIAAELLANPQEYMSYFPGLEDALQLETSLEPLRSMTVAAKEYPKYQAMLESGTFDLQQLQEVGEVSEEVKEAGEVSEEVQEVAEEVQEDGNNPKDVADTNPQELETVSTDNQEVQENTEYPEKQVEQSDMDLSKDSEFDEIMEGNETPADDGDLDLDDLEREWN